MAATALIESRATKRHVTLPQSIQNNSITTCVHFLPK